MEGKMEAGRGRNWELDKGKERYGELGICH
jgi:hypothetical protein